MSSTNSSKLSCSHKDLFYEAGQYSVEFLCQAGSAACQSKFSVLNLLHIFWCWMGGWYSLYFLAVVVIIFLIFRYTSIVVDEVVAEGIQVISNALGLSESLAAVTLLAFANGAGDFITSIVASDSDGGVSYNIGALFGAGLFVCSLVVGICIL